MRVEVGTITGGTNSILPCSQPRACLTALGYGLCIPYGTGSPTFLFVILHPFPRVLQQPPATNRELLALHYQEGHGSIVSILTQPVGRVQHRDSTRCSAPECSFNPHPARRPGATVHGGADVTGRGQVSILTQPVGRVQRLRGAGQRMVDADVSILTQPVGRVQPFGSGRACTPSRQFQSSPSP